MRSILYRPNTQIIMPMHPPVASDLRQRPPGRLEPQPLCLIGRPGIDYAPVRINFLERLHTAVLLMVFPCVMYWLPVYQSEALGTLTLLDCVWFALWGTSIALFLGSRRRLPRAASHCARICIFAVLIGCGYAIGTVVFGRSAHLGLDLARLMKMFGFPSIIPLSVCLVSRVRHIRAMFLVSVLLSVAFNVLVPFTGLQESLPLFIHFTDLTWVQTLRPTGAVSNPNDFGYISVAGLAIALGGQRTGRLSAPVRGLRFLVILVSLYGVATSGSRSAMVGLLCGAIYYVFSQHSGIATKVGVITAVLLFLVCGWQLSEVFRERMDTALTDKTDEVNFVGRLEAQTICLRTWAAWPLGVGSSNMPEATAPYTTNTLLASVEGSDSIYVDFLLGAGIEGLVCLLLCFGSCWTLGSAASLVPSRYRMLRAAMLAMFCIGFATLAPATPFVGPFFFALVALAALPDMPLKRTLTSCFPR